jgi:Mg2+/Co2+ transporter CorB
MFGRESLGAHPATGTANAVPANIDREVRSSEGMAPETVRLKSVLCCGARTTQDILTHRHRLKVVDIDTGWVTAQVIER